MKTNSYNETLTAGDGIEVQINYYEGAGRISVNAAARKAERSTNISISYKEDGTRETEVSDYSKPFDAAFYAELDAKLKKVAAVLSVETETVNSEIVEG